MEITALDLGRRFIGLHEVSGSTANPAILAMLQLDDQWPEDDSVPWCSAFVNYVCFLLDLPRSRSLRARSWLNVGRPVLYIQARTGFDVVILKRGAGEQPGPEVIDAPGHVGFYAGTADGRLLVLGGNQSDMVSIAPFAPLRILGVRRLYP